MSARAQVHVGSDHKRRYSRDTMLGLLHNLDLDDETGAFLAACGLLRDAREPEDESGGAAEAAQALRSPSPCMTRLSSRLASPVRVALNKENQINCSANYGNMTPSKWVDAGRSKPSTPPSPISELTDHKISQRKKQIDFGYRSIGYIRYASMIPKTERTPSMPRTPRADQKCSKRSWDAQIRQWRRDLHLFDPEDDLNFEPDPAVMKRIFGDDVDIPSALKMMHDREEELKAQAKEKDEHNSEHELVTETEKSKCNRKPAKPESSPRTPFTLRTKTKLGEWRKPSTLTS